MKTGIWNFINVNNIDEDKQNYIHYLIHDLQDAITKTRRDKMFHYYRIILEMYFYDLETKLPRSDRGGYYFSNSKKINATAFLNKINKISNSGRSDWKIINEEKENKDFFEMLSAGINHFGKINEGSHYNEKDIKVFEIDFKEVIFVVKSVIYCINLLNNSDYIMTESKYNKIREWLKFSIKQTKLIPKGSYVTTGKFDLLSVLEADEGIIIPYYQRAYVWEDSEIEQFLHSDGLYRGSITTKLSDSGWIIIDGQQRLTTIFIVMMLLFKEKEYKFDKTFIYESEVNNFPKDSKRYKKTIDIIKGFINNLDQVELESFKRKIMYSYFTVVGIDGEEQEVTNFRQMNIASKDFTNAEKNRTIAIDLLISNDKDHKKSITKTKNLIIKIENEITTDGIIDLEIFWETFNYWKNSSFNKSKIDSYLNWHLKIFSDKNIAYFISIYPKEKSDEISDLYMHGMQFAVPAVELYRLPGCKRFDEILLKSYSDSLGTKELFQLLIELIFTVSFSNKSNTKLRNFREGVDFDYLVNKFEFNYLSLVRERDFTSLKHHIGQIKNNLNTDILHFHLKEFEKSNFSSISNDAISGFLNFINFILSLSSRVKYSIDMNSWSELSFELKILKKHHYKINKMSQFSNFEVHSHNDQVLLDSNIDNIHQLYTSAIKLLDKFEWLLCEIDDIWVKINKLY